VTCIVETKKSPSTSREQEGADNGVAVGNEMRSDCLKDWKTGSAMEQLRAILKAPLTVLVPETGPERAQLLATEKESTMV
jgi:hypothetical protein